MEGEREHAGRAGDRQHLAVALDQVIASGGAMAHYRNFALEEEEQDASYRI